MRKAWLASLRERRAGFVRLAVLSIVLPLLLGLLPKPALSAEALLLRDIAGSFCLTGGQGQPVESGDEHEGHARCVLCAGAFAGGMAAPARTPGLSAPPRAPGHYPPDLRDGLPPLLRALLAASPPRGPPSASHA